VGSKCPIGADGRGIVRTPDVTAGLPTLGRFQEPVRSWSQRIPAGEIYHRSALAIEL